MESWSTGFAFATLSSFMMYLPELVQAKRWFVRAESWCLA